MTSDKLREVLRHRWWWLVIGVLVALVLAGGALLVMPRTYSSEAAILIEAEATNGDAAFSATSFVEERLPTYVDLGASDAAQDLIRTNLGQDLSREQIDSRVSYVATPGSMVLSIVGTGRSAQEAQATADAAASAVATTIEGTSTDVVEVTTNPVQGATRPSGAVDPDPMVVVPAAAVIGVAIPLIAALSIRIPSPTHGYRRRIAVTRAVIPQEGLTT